MTVVVIGSLRVKLHLFLQGQGTIEYVIEAPNLSEMTSWLMELKTCISPEPPPDTQQLDEESISPTM